MATEWVRVRNPRSGGKAVVPRKAVRMMPKWKEVKPAKAKTRSADEPTDTTEQQH